MKKLFFILALTLLNPAFNQTNLNSDNKSVIDSILQSYVQPNEPGMAVGIVKNGKIVYKNSTGIADLSNNLPITDSTAFNIASVSKHFTAFIALMAEEEGKISLEDDIRSYLPELNHLKDKITIKQLANHSHGLPNYSDLSQLINFGFEAPMYNDEIVQNVLKINTTNFEPGKQYQYGNSGYILLAEILKRVYDKPFPEIIAEKVFEPLNMNQSEVIDSPNAIIKNKAIAYTERQDGYKEYMDRQMSCGSSNVHTTLNDLIKWIVNFQEPTVGSQKQMNRLMTKTISFSIDSDLGYGLGLMSETVNGLKTVFHGGGTAGYRAYIMHVPEYDFSVVTLGNQDSFNGLLIIQDIMEVYLKEYIAEQKPVNITYSPEELKKFAGTYKFCPGQYWTIRSDEENLYFDGVDSPLPIAGERKFKFPLPTSYLTFHPDWMYTRIGDFNFHCEKININPPTLSEKELKKYTGIYKNETFNIQFEFSIVDNQLMATHFTTDSQTILNPMAKDSFYSGYPLGEFHFEFNKDGQTSGFVLDGQNFSNIPFSKVD